MTYKNMRELRGTIYEFPHLLRKKYLKLYLERKE
jgi:hypothetical protein